MSDHANKTHAAAQGIGPHLARWLRAEARLHEANRELNAADCEMMNAATALAQAALPADAGQGEAFIIIIGCHFLKIARSSKEDYTINWRPPAPSAAVLAALLQNDYPANL